MKHRILGLVSAVAVAVLLVGCVPKTEVVEPVSQPSVKPPFASDEEALAAAVEAYARYLKVTDEILHDGGKDPSLASTVMTGRLLESSLESFDEALAKGLHTVGQTSIDHPVLQRYDPYSDGAGVIVIYLCVDVSMTDVLNEAGNSIVSPDRIDRMQTVASFDLISNGESLLVESSELWSEKSC